MDQGVVGVHPGAKIARRRGAAQGRLAIGAQQHQKRAGRDRDGAALVGEHTFEDRRIGDTDRGARVLIVSAVTAQVKWRPKCRLSSTRSAITS